MDRMFVGVDISKDTFSAAGLDAEIESINNIF